MADKTPDESAEGIPLAGPGTGDPAFLASLSPDARQHLEDQVKDWSQYIADGPIYHLGELAYPDGAPVPASNVKRWKYDEDGLVAKVGTKKANEVRARSVPVTPSTVRAPGDE